MSGAPRTDLLVADIFSEFPELETERLHLRQLRPSDLDDVFAYASDPEVARYTSWEHARTIDDAQAFLDHVLDKYQDGEGTTWALELKETGSVIGSIRLGWTPSDAAAEVGYVIGTRHWNQGFATEALGRIARFGFEVLALNRLMARCMSDNLASARVMRKVGMVHEGRQRQQVYSRGVFCDMEIYSILRSEWIDRGMPGS
ncbi:MAG: GNAT family N-acetyltransferase [Candidatus Dormibacteria bacterium]